MDVSVTKRFRIIYWFQLVIEHTLGLALAAKISPFVLRHFYRCACVFAVLH